MFTAKDFLSKKEEKKRAYEEALNTSINVFLKNVLKENMENVNHYGPRCFYVDIPKDYVKHFDVIAKKLRELGFTTKEFSGNAKLQIWY